MTTPEAIGNPTLTDDYWNDFIGAFLPDVVIALIEELRAAMLPYKCRYCPGYHLTTNRGEP